MVIIVQIYPHHRVTEMHKASLKYCSTINRGCLNKIFKYCLSKVNKEKKISSQLQTNGKLTWGRLSEPISSCIIH